MPPNQQGNKPKLTKEQAEAFEEWYKERAAKEASKKEPSNWEEFTDRMRAIVREEQDGFFNRIFGEDEEGRPPAEGGGFWQRFMKASGGG